MLRNLLIAATLALSSALAACGSESTQDGNGSAPSGNPAASPAAPATTHAVPSAAPASIHSNPVTQVAAIAEASPTPAPEETPSPTPTPEPSAMPTPEPSASEPSAAPAPGMDEPFVDANGHTWEFIPSGPFTQVEQSCVDIGMNLPTGSIAADVAEHFASYISANYGTTGAYWIRYSLYNAPNGTTWYILPQPGVISSEDFHELALNSSAVGLCFK